MRIIRPNFTYFAHWLWPGAPPPNPSYRPYFQTDSAAVVFLGFNKGGRAWRAHGVRAYDGGLGVEPIAGYWTERQGGKAPPPWSWSTTFGRSVNESSQFASFSKILKRRNPQKLLLYCIVLCCLATVGVGHIASCPLKYATVLRSVVAHWGELVS